ncbi:MAG: sulfatase-like hydrolase/transferase, partial [Planctomycetota bacterium]
MRWVAGLVLLASGAACGPAPLTPEADLLIVTLHGLRADGVEALVREAPHLARLRESALRFEGARTPSPQTSPALVSLWSGRLPRRHGVVDESSTIAVSDPLFAETCRAAGYRTAAVLSPARAQRE